MSTVPVPTVDSLYAHYCKVLNNDPDRTQRAARPSREDVAAYFGIHVSQLGDLYRNYINVHEAALMLIERDTVHASQREAVPARQGVAVPAPQASMTSSTMPGTTGVQQALQTGPSSSRSANLKISITIQSRKKFGSSYRYYDQNNVLVACGEQHLNELGIGDEAEQKELLLLFKYLGTYLSKAKNRKKVPIHVHRWPTSPYPPAQGWHIAKQDCNSESCGMHRQHYRKTLA